MKKVYTALNNLEANLVIAELKQSGITGEIYGEHSQGIQLIQSAGYVDVYVPDDDYEDGIIIINKIEEKGVNSEAKNKSITNTNIFYFFIGALVGSLIFLAIYYLPMSIDKIDTNYDGKIDKTLTYFNNIISKTSLDRNFDGKVDMIFKYNRKGMLESSESDENFDNIFETVTKYNNGNPISSESDTTGDGYADYRISYKDGVINAAAFYSPFSKKPVKIQYFKFLKLYEAKLDTNKDGVLDTIVKYNDIEEIISVKTIDEESK